MKPLVERIGTALKPRTPAIVYCQSIGIENKFHQLKSTEAIIVLVNKLLSTRKQKNPSIKYRLKRTPTKQVRVTPFLSCVVENREPKRIYKKNQRPKKRKL